jgi:hypothetical protein
MSHGGWCHNRSLCERERSYGVVGNKKEIRNKFHSFIITVKLPQDLFQG